MRFQKTLSVLLSLLLLVCGIFPALAEDGSAEIAPTATPQALPKGFVRVTTSTMQGWLPLPLEEDYSYPLVQVAEDGTQVENVIHLMPDGFYMESSTCDNQLCVDEGPVTFDNIETRILVNAVYCLPHQVAIELFTLEEVLAMQNEAE